MSETLTIYDQNGSDASQTNVKGQKIVTDVDGMIVSAVVDASCDGTNFEIRASNATTVLSTASYSAPTATWNYACPAGTYYIVHNATNKSQAYRNSVSYPLNGTDINCTAGYSSSDGGDQSNVSWNFNSVTFQASTNVTINAAVQTLTLSQNSPTVTLGHDITINADVQTMTLTANAPTLTRVNPPMHVVGQTGTIKSAVANKNYPVTRGLTAGTERQEGHREFIDVEEDMTLVRDNTGLHR